MNQLNQFDPSCGKDLRTWREKHDAYLLSDHWKDLRKRCFVKSKHRCEACRTNKEKNLEGHHLIYREPIESGVLDDIMALCNRCHCIWHASLKQHGQTLSQFNRQSTATSIRLLVASDGAARKAARRAKKREAKKMRQRFDIQPQAPKYKVEMNLRPKHEILETVVFEQGKQILKLQQLCVDLQARVSILEQRNP